MDARILLAIHGLASPLLDGAFTVSDRMGSRGFLSVLVLLLAAYSLSRRERGEAALLVGLALSSLVLTESLKPLVARGRPHLWPRLEGIPLDEFSFPSGHALASATLYPLFARCLARRRPSLAVPAYGLAALLVLFVSLGRLYLGVHWPTDVAAGWAIAALQLSVALALRARAGTGQPAKILP